MCVAAGRREHHKEKAANKRKKMGVDSLDRTWWQTNKTRTNINVVASQNSARVGEGQMVKLDLTHMLVSIAFEVARNHEITPTAARVLAG